MKRWLKDLSTFKVLKLWLNCWRKFLTSKLSWQNKKRTSLDKMETSWSSVEVALVKPRVQFWDCFRSKCCSRSDFLFIRKSFHQRFQTLDAARTTLTRLVVCIAFSWPLHLYWQTRFSDITRSSLTTLRKSFKRKRKELRKKEREKNFNKRLLRKQKMKRTTHESNSHLI